MTVAVTGASGFLGAHVVRALLGAGAAVRVLLRPGGDRRNLAGLALEIVEGDLARGPLPPGFPGDAAFAVHCAALYSERPADREVLMRVNEGGTAALLAAAARDGVPRVVHVSTMGTCAPAPHGRPATEADRVSAGKGVSAYVASKLAAEDLALEARRLEVVVVCPAAPVGAFDRKPSVTGSRIRDVVRGRWPRLLAGPVNHVAAEACARGIVLAAERGRPGERYLLGGENLGPEAFLERVARAAGRPPPRPGLLDRLRGRARFVPGSLAIDDAKARAELGHAPGDLDLAFSEAARWFAGAVPRR